MDKSLVKKPIQYLPVVYTQDERDKLLIGYEEVPAAGYLLLTPGTHVRYTTKKGEFRRGGFVHNVKKTDKAMVFLENNRDSKAPGYIKFPVTLADVDKLWKKRTLEDVVVKTSSDLCEARIAVLESEFERMSNEIKKLIQIISRLNEKVAKTTLPGASTTR